MMKLRSLFCVAGAGLATLLPAQAGRTESGESAPPPASKTTQTKEPSIAEWVEQLGSESFRRRVDAENKLRELGKDAVAELQKAADESADSEVQWRARRLLRQIESGDRGPVGLRRDPRRERPAEVEVQPQEPVAPRQGPRIDRFDDMQRRFDEMFQGLERDFGIEVGRRGFFGDDFFRDLTEQMEQLRQQTGPARGMTMRIDGDGVRVEVQEPGEDGKLQTKVYEAPSLEELHKQHPELMQGQGMALPFRFWSGGRDAGGLHGLGERRRWLVDPAEVPFLEVTPQTQVHVAVASGEVLGVQVRPEISGDLREHLGLSDGQGLLVEAVTPDSLASAMGLQRGDIVLEVAGLPVGEPGDVRQALGKVEAGKKVEVVCLRKGERTTLHADKPAAVQVDGGRTPARGTLQKRERKDGETIR